jgi:hypothetical protein
MGITPSGPETEYGWIEPQRSILGSLPRSITRVSCFWEKPNANVARSLMEQGCLWNSFVMVGRVDALLRMTREALPELFLAFARTVPMFGGLWSEARCAICIAGFLIQIFRTRCWQSGLTISQSCELVMLAGAILASRRAYWRRWRKWESEQKWRCQRAEKRRSETKFKEQL